MRHYDPKGTAVVKLQKTLNLKSLQIVFLIENADAIVTVWSEWSESFMFIKCQVASEVGAAVTRWTCIRANPGSTPGAGYSDLGFQWIP